MKVEIDIKIKKVENGFTVESDGKIYIFAERAYGISELIQQIISGVESGFERKVVE